MIQKDKTYNLATFFCLYIAQTIPMSFFSTVIPVMMRQEDFSLSAIGLLQLIKLPWILKFLWSPMVDRHAVTTGDYKRWIFSSELIYAGLIFAVAFLDFHTDFYTIVALIIISFVASATQDIATDALAVLAFSRKDKSLANSMQSMGSFGGSMIGGGVLLLLFKQIGWNGLLPCVALFVIAALLPLFFNKDIRIQPKEAHERAKKADVIYFFARRSIWKQMRGGEKDVTASMFVDDNNRIMYGKLEPGASIGMHTHETNSEIIYILSGKGKVLFEGEYELVSAGLCHYCPQGCSHSLINDSNDNLTFFAVVPEHIK